MDWQEIQNNLDTMYWQMNDDDDWYEEWKTDQENEIEVIVPLFEYNDDKEHLIDRMLEKPFRFPPEWMSRKKSDELNEGIVEGYMAGIPVVIFKISPYDMPRNATDKVKISGEVEVGMIDPFQGMGDSTRITLEEPLIVEQNRVVLMPGMSWFDQVCGMIPPRTEIETVQAEMEGQLNAF